MTWKEVIAKASAFLAAKGVPDAQVAAELLAARLLKCGRGLLASSLGKETPEKYLEAMRRGMARLAKGEPLQYVLGEWDFRTLTLGCDRRALMPRPETEELVTRVLGFLRARPATPGVPPVVIDVGTGTGAIVLSLAKEFRREAVFIGTDVSEDAIALAKENAVRCGLADRPGRHRLQSALHRARRVRDARSAGEGLRAAPGAGRRRVGARLLRQVSFGRP